MAAPCMAAPWMATSEMADPYMAASEMAASEIVVILLLWASQKKIVILLTLGKSIFYLAKLLP